MLLHVVPAFFPCRSRYLTHLRGGMMRSKKAGAALLHPVAFWFDVRHTKGGPGDKAMQSRRFALYENLY